MRYINLICLIFILTFSQFFLNLSDCTFHQHDAAQKIASKMKDCHSNQTQETSQDTKCDGICLCDFWTQNSITTMSKDTIKKPLFSISIISKELKTFKSIKVKIPLPPPKFKV